MITIDSSILSNYYLSKEGILASSSSTSAGATSATTSTASSTPAAPEPPWDAPTPKAQTVSAASALATKVLGGQNIIQPLAHGKPVLFLHPKDFSGTLVELEQA